MNSIKKSTILHYSVTDTPHSQVSLLQILQNINQLPTDEQITALSNFLAKTVQHGIEGSSDFVSTSIARAFIVFIRHHGRLTLGEMLLAMQLLETLLIKCREKKDNTIDTDNLGTALVCVFIVALKFARDIPYRNSWWAS